MKVILFRIFEFHNMNKFDGVVIKFYVPAALLLYPVDSMLGGAEKYPWSCRESEPSFYIFLYEYFSFTWIVV